MAKTRFIMIGGFLGAGKTTTIARLAALYQQRGQTIGIVTNDQATDLVDTHALRSQGFDVGEVAGACFCCNFNELTETIAKLEAAKRPDLILAEPVGSCTDLVATVVRPLEQLYGEQFDVAPYGVILKPSHGRRILESRILESRILESRILESRILESRILEDRPLEDRPRSGFSPKAAYIFRKQLEEADFVLVNRIDQLPAEEVDTLSRLIEREYPSTKLLRISAKTGEGFDAFLAMLDQPADVRRKEISLDYDIYAAGEAELGWLNSSLTVSADVPFDLDHLLLDIISRLQQSLAALGAETAHLKTIGLWQGIDGDRDGYGVANLTSGDGPVELSLPSNCQVQQAEIIVNARVAIDPEILTQQVQQAVHATCKQLKIEYKFRQTQSFRPGRPVPTHRLGAKP